MKRFRTKKIPRGPYCYSHTGRVVISNVYIGWDGERHTGGHYFKPEIAPCPFWEGRDNGNAYCAYLKESSEYGDFGNLLWDQVKECGVNDEDDFTYLDENYPQNALTCTELRAKRTPEFIESLVLILVDSPHNSFIYDGVEYTLDPSLLEYLKSFKL